ncbi:MAG TPA: hypothetical protein VLI90_07790 [Tepidisphaeraceae bacterium]|nr:hypothetical protein [Tepidisphaeraceae bacterium]
MPKQANYLRHEQLEQVLSPTRLALPARPRVEEIKVEEYQD